jgi:hypothetical protein
VSQDFDAIFKIPAKTLACLRPGYLSIFVGYGLGGAEGGVPQEIPIELVPIDLRLPNAEFTVILDRSIGRIVGVERKAEVE